MALARYEGVVQDMAGNAVPLATIEVRRDEPGRPIVPLFSDRSGTVSIGNPIQADPNGAFGFHLPGGAYWVRAYTGPTQQPTFEVIKRYVGLGTAGERDVEDLATALSAGLAMFATWAELMAFPVDGSRVAGRVLNDPDPTKNGDYAPIADTWVWQRGFPDTFAVLHSVAGSNAVTAFASPAVDPATVVLKQLTPFAANTGPMTLAVNGEVSRPLLDFAGAPVAAGYVQPGVPILIVDDGLGNYRLLVDHRFQALSAATVLAAANADTASDLAVEAQIGAEAARDLAESYTSDAVSQGNVPIYSTLDGLAALDVPVGITALRVNGRSAAGDGGASLLKKVVGGAGPGRWPSAAGLWEVSDKILKPDYFGSYVGDGIADDDAAIRKMLQYAKRGHKIVLTPTFAAADGATIIMAGGDLFYENGIDFDGGGLGIILKQKPASNPTHGFLVSKLITVDATTDAFQKGKLRPTFKDLYLDCNGAFNTTGHGFVVIADAPLLDSVFIKDSPWCGLRLQHSGLAGSQQANGLNMLHATLRRIRVDNFGLAFRLRAVDDPLYVAAANENIDLDKATGVFAGASQNGKMTDAFATEIAIVSGPRGMFLGSAAGWLGDRIRIANVDDGLATAQVNRTFLDAIEIDDYGRGWDVAKRAFDGVLIGRMLTRRAHGHFTGQIQTQQGAGATTAFTYNNVRMLNPTTGIMDCEVTADFDMVSDNGAFIDPEHPELGVKAGLTYGYVQEKGSERSVIGRLDGTMRGVRTPLDLDPSTRLLTNIVEIASQIGFNYEIRGQETITAGVATSLAALKLPLSTPSAPAGGAVEVDVFVSRLNGYAHASRSFSFSYGRSGETGIGGHRSDVQAGLLAHGSQNSSRRDITGLVLTVTTSGAPVDTFTINLNPTFAGDQPDTDARVTWVMRVRADRSGLSLVAA